MKYSCRVSRMPPVVVVAEIEVGECANVDQMQQIQAVGNQRIGAAARKDQGRTFVIIDGSQADRNVCLFGVLGFNKGLSIGINPEEVDAFVTPEGEILRRIREIVYERLALN